MQVTFSARRWERDHFQAFQAWSAQRNLPASRIAGLGSVLLEHFHEVLAQPESCQHFVESLPKALQECDDPSTYQEPMAVEAYAYLHLLERYRRFWTVLMRLVEVGRLPLARTEVRLLDVGAGPAPVTYATIDFYQALHAYSTEQQAENPAGKVLPETVESSALMVRWAHLFAERAILPGPFGPSWTDASAIDPIGRSRDDYAAEVRRIADELDTSEEYARQWLAAERGQPEGRLRLVVFSNFLTTPEMLDLMEPRLRIIRQWLFPGAVVVVLGGTEGHYPALYQRLDDLLAEGRMARIGELDGQFQSPGKDDAARAISAFQAEVWRILAPCADTGALRRSLVDALSGGQGFNSAMSYTVRAYRVPDRRASPRGQRRHPRGYQ